MTSPRRKPKKTSAADLWPVWAVLGCFALVVIYLTTLKGGADITKGDIGQPVEETKPDPNKPPPEPRKPGPGRPLDGLSLQAGWSVRISAETPMVDEAGGDVKADGVKKAPPGSIIKVLSRQWVERTRWYNVEVSGPDGRSLGTGWMRSMNLDGQNLKLVE
jgi:hypothetical protein